MASKEMEGRPKKRVGNVAATGRVQTVGRHFVFSHFESCFLAVLKEKEYLTRIGSSSFFSVLKRAFLHSDVERNGRKTKKTRWQRRGDGSRPNCRTPFCFLDPPYKKKRITIIVMMMMIKVDYVAFLVHLAVGTGEIRGSSSVEFGSEFLFVCLFVFFFTWIPMECSYFFLLLLGSESPSGN